MTGRRDEFHKVSLITRLKPRSRRSTATDGDIDPPPLLNPRRNRERVILTTEGGGVSRRFRAAEKKKKKEHFLQIFKIIPSRSSSIAKSWVSKNILFHLAQKNIFLTV